MYKPLSWKDGLRFLPKKWIDTMFTHLNEEDKKYYQEYSDTKEEKMENKKILDNFLIKGKSYKVYNRYDVVYVQKIKRTHIFRDRLGTLVKFRNLNLKQIEVVEQQEKK